MSNIIQFPGNPNAEMLDVMEWEWSDFKLVWENVAEMSDEDEAWKVIHEIWQKRAGEIK